MTFSVAIFCLESDEENESGAAGQQQRRRTPQKRQRRSNANRSNNYDANAAAAAAQQPQQPKERPDAKHHLKVLLPPQATILSLGLFISHHLTFQAFYRFSLKLKPIYNRMFF